MPDTDRHATQPIVDGLGEEAGTGRQRLQDVPAGIEPGVVGQRVADCAQCWDRRRSGWSGRHGFDRRTDSGCGR